MQRKFSDRENLVLELFLLVLEESEKGDTGELGNLESNSGNITHSMALTTKTGNENLVILVAVVQATVIGNEGSDFLTILNELDSDALTNGRVRLLGLDTNLLSDNALGVGSSTERVVLELCAEGNFLVLCCWPTCSSG